MASSSGRQLNFAALNRGRHLCSAGRTSGWALAHILVMVALCNRADHIYFHPVSSSSFFFPRLISAVGDWMSTILPHMVWPQCEFRMQVWNVLHVARWKYRTQKWRKKSPSRYHPTTLSGYIFATKACIDNRKKNLLSSNISSTCPHNMVNFGLLAAEILSGVWGTPATFNGFRVVAALLHGM